MQGIEFEEDRSFSGPSKTASQVPAEKPSLVMGLLEKMGIADKTTANFILLSVAAIFFGITIFLYSGILAKPEKDWSLDARAILEAQKYQR